MSDEFPVPATPPTPAALLAWLGDVIEGAWVDVDGRRAVVRDVAGGTAHLDIVPPDGWPDVTQVRYLIAIAHPAATPEAAVCVRCCTEIDGPVTDDGDGPRHEGGCTT